jgi:hypothetical protein
MVPEPTSFQSQLRGIVGCDYGPRLVTYQSDETRINVTLVEFGVESILTRRIGS